MIGGFFPEHFFSLNQTHIAYSVEFAFSSSNDHVDSMLALMYQMYPVKCQPILINVNPVQNKQKRIFK